MTGAGTARSSGNGKIGSLWLPLAFVASLATSAVVVCAAARPARAAEPGEGVNACGCRKDSGGTCYCDRKAKCGCPGECEPKGCEEKRAKQMEREIELETKKAQEAARKQKASDGDDSPAPAAAARAPEPAAAKAKPAKPARALTAAERKTLGRLLDLYLAEHPDARGQSVGEARAAIGE